MRACTRGVTEAGVDFLAEAVVDFLTEAGVDFFAVGVGKCWPLSKKGSFDWRKLLAVDIPGEDRSRTVCSFADLNDALGLAG